MLPCVLLTARSWQSASDHLASRPGRSSRPELGGGARALGGRVRRHGGVAVGRVVGRVARRVPSTAQRQPATPHLEPQKDGAAHDHDERRPQHAVTVQSIHRSVNQSTNQAIDHSIASKNAKTYKLTDTIEIQAGQQGTSINKLCIG